MGRSLNLFANALFFVYLCIRKQEIFRFIIKVSSFFIVIGFSGLKVRVWGCNVCPSG